MKSFKPNNESRLLCSMTCRVYRKVALLPTWSPTVVLAPLKIA